MAIISIDRKTFEKEIGKIDEKMEEKIALMGTPVEAVTNNEIQIEVFPNRPDMLSYHGFKRAFLAYLGKKTGLMKYKLNPPEKDYQVVVDSSLKNIRPCTACAIVRGLQLDDERIRELIEIQEKLHTTIGRKRKKVAIGIYPLEKIKLPITFLAMEPEKIKFVPLEAEREMSGFEILQRHPTGKEYAHLLSGKEKYPVFIDADKNILSMPPIINSQLTGKITEKTRDVFVECSGSEFEVLKKCLNILVTTMSDIGGKIYQMEVKYPKKEITPNLNPEEMKISIENTNKLLGLNLNEKQVKQFLERMGYDYNKGTVKIPAWRTDILHEVDLIEDVAISYGYDKFVPEIPEISTIGHEDGKEIFKRKISEIFSGLGMLEASNYHLTNKKFQFKNMNLEERGFVGLEESKTDFNILRRDLTHYLLKIISENPDSEYPQKVFEVGKVFELKENNIIEKTNLAAAITPGNFTDVKQALEHLSKMTGIEIKIEEEENPPEFFIKGRVGKIKSSEKKIGFIGEIHPKILRNWKIKMPVSIFEINLENIF